LRGVGEESANGSPVPAGDWREVLRVFFGLGLTSFGGPIAHLAYFRSEFVERRRWLDEAAYAGLVALCQFLPGPTSSQTGIALGLMRAGPMGAFAAFAGFTAPSAIAMILFGYGVARFPGIASGAALHGLKIVAVAVVAQAVVLMARTLTPDLPRAIIAVLAAVFAIAVPSAFGQIAVIATGGIAGVAILTGKARKDGGLPVPVSPSAAAASMAIFLLLLGLLPMAAILSGNRTIAVIDGFYRAGALVFGGGHVVLPLLQSATVPQGWVSSGDFLAGYGAAQAVPGPLFTFAAYLGTVMTSFPNGWIGGLITLFAIFLPSFLLVFGAIPVWNRWRSYDKAQSALSGINAAVVGLLAAALYDPLFTGAIFTVADFALAAAAFLLLNVFRTPPWLAVMLAAMLGAGAASLMGPS
jgi:chromate transporter